MWSVFLILVISSSNLCLGRPQQQQQQQQGQIQRGASMAEMQAHGAPLEQGSPHHPGTPVRVQHRDINIVNEPTCDELKAMWRLSKRQARTPEILNEISTYKDPFSYNEWAPYYGNTNAGYVSSSRSAGGGAGSRYRTTYGRRPTVFGRVIHKAPMSSAVGFPSHGGRGYEQVARLYGALQGDTVARRPNVLRLPGGGIPAQAGKFNHLKEIIRTERARELQQQREAEMVAAKAAELKEIVSGQRYRDEMNHAHKHRDYLHTPYGGPQDLYGYSDDPSTYHTPRDRYSGDSINQHQAQEGIITYPDVMAAPSRRSGMWQVHSQQFLNSRDNSYDQRRGQHQQNDDSIFVDRRSAPLLLPSPVDMDSIGDDYIPDPVMIEDPQLYLEPFLFNFHNNLDKSFFDGHGMRRSGSNHYLFE